MTNSMTQKAELPEVPAIVWIVLLAMMVLGLCGASLGAIVLPIRWDVIAISLIVVSTASLVSACMYFYSTVAVTVPTFQMLGNIALVSLGVFAILFTLLGGVPEPLVALMTLLAGGIIFATAVYSFWWADRLVIYNRTLYPPLTMDS